MALTADRDPYEVPDQRTLPKVPMAAASKVYAGGLVCLDASGNAQAGADGAGKAYGIAMETVDNTGIAGALSVQCRAGIFHFTNSSGDPVAAADFLETVYAEADDIAAKTQNATGTLPVLGKFMGIDPDHGVKVWVGALSVAGAKDPVCVELTIPDISTGDTVYSAAPVSGKVVAIYSCIDAAITSVDAGLTFEIGGTPMTGSAITVAFTGSAPGDVDSSTPSALNYVSAGDTLSAVTDGLSSTTSLARITFVIQPD